MAEPSDRSDWDAGTYQRVSEPQLAWGRQVVGRIALEGDEDALDAGCGTGRVTRLLAERLPRGTVLAVDASPSMVEEAARQLSDLPRVRTMVADLTALEVEEPVDLIVSTATFHWILEQARLYARLHAALRPGGRLVAQCGGAGNIARTLRAAATVAARAPYAASLEGMEDAWVFPDHHVTAERLEDAGFGDVQAWLEDAPAYFPDVETGAEFLATVVLRHHLMRLPSALGPPFARDVAALCAIDDGRVEVDYVRLNMEARRPA